MWLQPHSSVFSAQKKVSLIKWQVTVACANVHIKEQTFCPQMSKPNSNVGSTAFSHLEKSRGGKETPWQWNVLDLLEVSGKRKFCTHLEKTRHTTDHRTHCFSHQNNCKKSFCSLFVSAQPLIAGKLMFADNLSKPCWNVEEHRNCRLTTEVFPRIIEMWKICARNWRLSCPRKKWQELNK